jgi:hypothetical protein
MVRIIISIYPIHRRSIGIKMFINLVLHQLINEQMQWVRCDRKDYEESRVINRRSLVTLIGKDNEFVMNMFCLIDFRTCMVR